MFSHVCARAHRVRRAIAALWNLYQAVRVARGIKGVTSVKNDMSVK